MDTLYLWQAAYFAALYETDQALIHGRILEARAALEQRRLSPIDGEESRALETAEHVLHVFDAERKRIIPPPVRSCENRNPEP
jgi:hypothetical protein